MKRHNDYADVENNKALTHGEFFQQVDAQHKCGNADCGVAMRNCPDCAGPITVIVPHAAPIIQIACERCEQSIQEFKLVPVNA